MRSRVQTLIAALAIASVALTIIYVRLPAQVVAPRPEELRYRALLTEPVASADGRSVVAGTSVLLVRDRHSGQCFLAVMVGNSMGLSPATCER